jgi:hypothetical protein
VNVTKGRSY